MLNNKSTKSNKINSGNYYLSIIIWILFQCIVLSHAIKEQRKHCKVVFSDQFDDCSKERSGLEIRRSNEEKQRTPGASSTPSSIKGVCMNEEVCRKRLNITRIHQQSFSEQVLVRISDMLDQCCGNCVSYVLDDIYTDIAHVNESLINSSDIIYPVIGQSNLIMELHGFHYIPVLNIPTAYYIMLRNSKQKVAINMVNSCLNMWPLITICLLMALISGVIAWSMEARLNKEEFPRHFHVGLFEGFWWSFISMTTVGYGDKTPKSHAGRLFAIVWILIGITICSIFTASLTTEVINAHNLPDADLNGKFVGGLKHQVHDAIMIVQHGGILRDIAFNDTVIGVAELINMMERKIINGFLINKSTYHYFSKEILLEKYRDVARSISSIDLIRTEKFFRGTQLVTGMLVRNDVDYEYFKKYFNDNWLQIQTCYSYHLIHEETRFKSVVHSTVEGLFYPFLYSTIGILGVLVSLGTLYEIRWKRRKKMNNNQDVKGCEGTINNNHLAN